MMKPILIMLAVNAIYAIGQFKCNPDEDCKMRPYPVAVPDPEDCHNFYVCKDNMAADNPYSCGQDRFFNGDGLEPSCEEGDCISPLCTPSAPVCKTSCVELSSGEGLIVFPGECSSFYACSSLGTFRVECSKNEYFNGTGCAPDWEDACCGVCGAPICTEGMDIYSKLPDKDNCQNFYICVNGDALLQKCPDGEMFDLPDAECKTSANAECSIYCQQITTTIRKKGPTTETPINNPDPSGCIDIDDYICDVEGGFPLCPTLCQQVYVSCLTINGDLVASESTCPSELFFSPTLSACIPLEDCEMFLEGKKST